MRPLIRPEEAHTVRSEQEARYLDAVIERLNGIIVERYPRGRAVRCSCRVPRHLRKTLNEHLLAFGWQIFYPPLRNLLLDTVILQPLSARSEQRK